jgi:hypothetical protein
MQEVRPIQHLVNVEQVVHVGIDAETVFTACNMECASLIPTYSTL